MNVYAIFDNKADVFGVPWFMMTNGLATRAFADLANDRSSTVSKHPGDFKLVKIAVFDERSGVITPVEHESLGFATDYVERPSNNVEVLRGASR